MAKIIVADDSVFMRKLIGGILRTAGYTDIIEAGDGDDALKNSVMRSLTSFCWTS